MANKSESLTKLTVDLDCSDAIKGLKAIQREAKEASRAIKELEGYTEPIGYIEAGHGDIEIKYTDKLGVPRTVKYSGNLNITLTKR